MAKLTPWYKVVTPREDLREGRPLDAAEFAVHLDQVRDGRAQEDYQNPTRFFERTFLTGPLRQTASEVLRRLAGENVGASAVFNMTTQFGGGKTHALTLLYHLAVGGSKAKGWMGVPQILAEAKISEIPRVATAVFVGTEFDVIDGRGGDDGTPLRKTAWGEIAFQLSGEAGFKVVEKQDCQGVAPGGDVIRKFLPKDRACLILIDELVNYLSRSRKLGGSSQLYSFFQNLSEEARGSDRMVLVASIPASELEMTPEDQSDHERFKKLLDRLGKAVIMAAESETSEIIRRRLFEWDPRAVNQDGRVILSKDAVKTCEEYANWVNSNKTQIPLDHASEEFKASYPFHPSVLSVFERKWQSLPRFQRTRGVLRLLALWVSHAYRNGFKGADKDALIDLGSAPLEDPQFRSALFEQLGEAKLEGAVTTDICGKNDSHAIRLDQDADESIKKSRLHRKVATSIFFESNGGQTKDKGATVPEIRLAVAGPDTDLGNAETVLEALTDACYYLTVERNEYRFSLKENLNKRFSDRRAMVVPEDIESRIREDIQKVFPAGEGVERIFFPDKSGQIPDRPAITLVVLEPDHSFQECPNILARIDSMTKEYGRSARVFKSGLLWIVAESGDALRACARDFLAWEDIKDEGLNLDEAQARQLDLNVKKGARDLQECVWRTYKNVVMLAKDGQLKRIDLGLVTSSAAASMTMLILNELRRTDDVVKDVAPRFLVKNWPPALTEWSTRAVRDAFYSSPQFPKLLYPHTVKDTIARGVKEGLFAYVGKSAKGKYEPLIFEALMTTDEVEISADIFIIPPDEARKQIEPPRLARVLVVPSAADLKPGAKQAFSVEGLDQFGQPFNAGKVSWSASGGKISADGVFAAGKDEGTFLVTAEKGDILATASVTIRTQQTPPVPGLISKERTARRLLWFGAIPHQKWTNFYMKVLTKLVSTGDVSINVTVQATPKSGVTDQQIEETKANLRGLGLDDEVRGE